MIVPSPEFLLFAALGAIVFNIRAAVQWRQYVLLVVNLLFLLSFSHDPASLAPLAGFLALSYASYRLTRNGTRPFLFVALLVLILAVFFWLKRYTFILSSSFLPFPYLLVGLSYIFFRVMHLVIDGHQGAIEEPVGVLSYVNYTVNFTSLISGPIQRYQDYRQTEATPPALTLIDAGKAVERIVIGYFKVAMVSAGLSLLQHRAMGAMESSVAFDGRVLGGIATIAIYPVFLYFNFSGYVDVVIGVARFFRIVLPENFNRPFSSENFIGFWGRWHITLSGWLKTYVYNPLMMAGMTRITAPKLTPYLAVVAFFVTFFLVGLWHGQTSEFLFFGILQGGGVAANKLYQVMMQERLGRKQYRALASNALYRACCRGLTFTWFAFTLLWFWSDWGSISRLFLVLGVAGTVLAMIGIWSGASLLLAAMEAGWTALNRPTDSANTASREPFMNSRYVRTVWVTTLVVVTLSVRILLSAPAPEIVYKAF